MDFFWLTIPFLILLAAPAAALLMAARQPPTFKPRPAPSAPPAAELSARSLRSSGPLMAIHAALPSDLDDFALAILSAHPGSCVLRESPFGDFPCYVVAIPDDGLSFDLRPVAIDPRSQLAELEALVLSTHAQQAESLRSPAPRL